jgi:hypothetical protein
MRTTLLPVRSGRVRLLYAGVAVFVLLAALTARSVWRAWNERAGQARAAAVFDLVQQRMPSRPTEAPGAMAWLREQLAAYGHRLPPTEAAMYARMWADSDTAPPELAPVVAAMRDVAASPDDGGLTGGVERRTAAGGGRTADGAVIALNQQSHDGLSRRAVSMVTAGDSRLVVTRRRALESDVGSNRFVRRFAGPMARARQSIDRALRGGGRPVRLYAVAEDGTLLSLPWPSSAESPETIARLEGRQLAARPTLPSFAPEEFFFTFEAAEHGVVRYSGFYLDLGGRGLVSTLTIPLDSEGHDGVLALDIAHDINWQHFASTIAPPIAAGIVHIQGGGPPTWPSLREALGISAPQELRTAIDRIVEARRPTEPAVTPITHAVVANVGAVAAFQVAEATWLLTLFPSRAPSFPGGAIALLGVVLAVLLAGFEVNRRKAEREADKAARALGEKQNLLNTMQVPLMVVDPNTDVIVSANKVAESIGIRRGTRFIDRISADPRARAHYERTQVATTEARRAYGVPIRIDGDSEGASEQFAIIRSVAVTAPIEALEADERHRLGILFLVDPRSDLALMIEDVESNAHRDERRRLAGLLSHGLDPLVQVLQRSLPGSADRGLPELSAWLAEYVERRIHVTAWLLDNWDREAPTHDAVVDAAQALETLSSLERVFSEARGDADLRARLGWANGPLSSGGRGPTFSASIDWPSEFEMTLPVRGGLGFFLTEALSNAMRHGAAASVPSVLIRPDRIRRELEVTIENERRDDRPQSRSSYGGLSILEGMARLFGWREFSAGPRGSRFAVSWRAPVTRRDQPGKPD